MKSEETNRGPTLSNPSALRLRPLCPNIQTKDPAHLQTFCVELMQEQGFLLFI